MFAKAAAILTMALMMAMTPVRSTGGVACAQEGNYVGVVVRLDEKREIARCIEFEGETITGLQALQAAGFDVVTKDLQGALGVAVCKIEDVGTDTCDFNAGFWGYFHATPEGTWQESPAGSQHYVMRRGDIDAWTWKPAMIGRAPQPQQKPDINEICKSGPHATAEGRTGRPNFLVPLLVAWVVAASAAVIIALVRRRRRAAETS